jgi:hypothetical protein
LAVVLSASVQAPGAEPTPIDHRPVVAVISRRVATQIRRLRWRLRPLVVFPSRCNANRPPPGMDGRFASIRTPPVNRRAAVRRRAGGCHRRRVVMKMTPLAARVP